MEDDRSDDREPVIQADRRLAESLQVSKDVMFHFKHQLLQSVST